MRNFLRFWLGIVARLTVSDTIEPLIVLTTIVAPPLLVCGEEVVTGGGGGALLVAVEFRNRLYCGTSLWSVNVLKLQFSSSSSKNSPESRRRFP